MKSYYNSTSNASLKVLEDAGGIVQLIVVDQENYKDIQNSETWKKLKSM